MTGYLIHEDDVPLLHGTMRAFRGGSRNLPPTKKGKQPPANRPPIVAVLLEDLPSGQTVEAAVLVLEETHEVQLVTILGTVTGGFFQLRFKPTEDAEYETTGELPYDATPSEVQAALEGLPSLQLGDVEVSLGQGMGRWLIAFTGQYADKDVPLLATIDGLLEGLDGAIVVSATTFLDDTGRNEIVRSLIPVGIPTPLVAGAVVIAIWFPGVGYVAISVECREFDFEPGYPY